MGGTTAYPAAVDSFGSVADAVDIIIDDHINDLRRAAEAIETALGITPIGASATVAARILALETGWVPAGETWTRTAAATFTVPTDLTAKYQKNTKIKLTDTTTKYFYVVSSSYSAPNTTVTVTGGSDYSLVGAISNPFYSYVENPQGFPDWFTYAPQIVGYSSAPGTTIYCFKVAGKACIVSLYEGANGTSNSTSMTYTVPIACAATTQIVIPGPVDDGAAVANGIAQLPSGGSVINCYKASYIAWTNSGNKRLGGLQVTYPI